MSKASKKKSLANGERDPIDTPICLSSEIFESVFRESRAGMLIISLEGRLLAANPAICSFLGYSEQELLAVNIESITYSDDSAREAVREVYDERKNLLPVEMRYRHKDGQPRWGEVSASLVYGDDGQPLYVLAQVVNIADRKLKESALRESEDRLQMATQTGNMLAYEWDARTDKLVRSEGVKKILGEHEAEHTTGHHILGMIPPEDRERLTAAVAQLTPEKPFLRIRYRMIRSDNTVIWVDRNSRAYFDEQGKLLRIVGLLADITDRVRAEEAAAGLSRKLLDAQEQERVRIARELHDDIGQRLALLSFGIQRMKDNLHDSTERRRLLDGLEKQTSEIATDLQTLSHELHTGQLEYVGLVAAMRGLCTAIAAKQKVKIKFIHERIPSNVPQEVSLCLFRVMQEALNNAVKHSGVRHFEVKLEGSATEISLAIRDAGVGFDPELTKTTQGLGLVSMRERVNLLKGTCSISSKPQSGTEVSVRVPVSNGLRTEQAEFTGA